ncbi:MAG: hypothetical protein LBJ39_03105, partial [Tannerellaceae bacterium]|nr:hypothetical protein [Tannerellaceae bacterium]
YSDKPAGMKTGRRQTVKKMSGLEYHYCLVVRGCGGGRAYLFRGLGGAPARPAVEDREAA